MAQLFCTGWEQTEVWTDLGHSRVSPAYKKCTHTIGTQRQRQRPNRKFRADATELSDWTSDLVGADIAAIDRAMLTPRALS